MDTRHLSPINERPAGYGRLRAALELAWIAALDGALWLADGARTLYWALADRIAVLGPRGRLATAGGAALAAGIGVAALAIAVSGGSGSATSTTDAPVAIVKSAAPTSTTTASAPAAKIRTEATKPKAPPAPTLHGAAPVFTPPKGDGNAKVAKGEAVESAAATTEEAIKPANAPAATAEIGATPAATAGATRTATGEAGGEGSPGVTQLDGPPAGPKAVRVARNFAGAFVVYETGGIDSGVRETFGDTATPELSHSLLKRPPRLPANVRVPRAKVVNVVPGPSQGKVFTVSVSLLRVGVTSELRLEMEQRKHDGWQVTNVLG